MGRRYPPVSQDDHGAAGSHDIRWNQPDTAEAVQPNLTDHESPQSQTDASQDNERRKTLLCQHHFFGTCLKAAACDFAHGEKEQVRPRGFGERQKVKWCDALLQTAFCKYGRNCHYAHQAEELEMNTPAQAVQGAVPVPRPELLELVLDVIEVAPEIHDQLAHGMLYHFNRFLRHLRLQARLRESQVELLSLGEEEAPAQTVQEEIHAELLRLASLRQELTERIPMSQHLVKRLIGPQGQICRMLSRDLGVQVYVQNSTGEDSDAIVELTGVPVLLEQARATLEQHLISFLQSPPHCAVPELQFAAETQEVLHVFVDNSNISIGCQFLPSGTRDFSQRLNIPKFVQAVAGVRQVQRQVVVGSKPPRGHAIWQHWENAGFQVLVEWRDPESNREQFVDARLVAEALMHVSHVDRLRSQGDPRGHGRHVFVLSTGDGNLEGQAAGTAGANFINLAKEVAQRGWKVEVWCWNSTCSSSYRRLAEDPNLQVKICFLDGLRSKITMTSRPQEEEENLCMQCLANASTYAFQPCNHKVLCQDCAALIVPHKGRQPLGLCFICRLEWRTIVAVPDHVRSS
ncbi:CCCH-type zinc finger protein moe-3 (Maturation oocyte expansion protein 3) [Durusdinium trenchii]|uniref:CCCH-type zinc finger protein moe-3 (Maturation oocyte expansion protein 3) n=1 Tax=Durusdinium trenchii TaxID=1381693 RepID=A0ABP0QBZ2_9DINO